MCLRALRKYHGWGLYLGLSDSTAHVLVSVSQTSRFHLMKSSGRCFHAGLLECMKGRYLEKESRYFYLSLLPFMVMRVN